MMKRFLSTVVALMLAAVSFAQMDPGDWFVMPRVGLNLSNMKGVDDCKNRQGLLIGAELGYQLNGWSNLTLGAQYSMQGIRYTLPGYESNWELDYINVPLIANVYIIDNLAIKAGVQAGFLVRNHGDVVSFVDDERIDVDESAYSPDVSIPLGVSYEFANLMLEFRYNLGVRRIMKDPDYNYKHQVIQVSVGYKFKL